MSIRSKSSVNKKKGSKLEALSWIFDISYLAVLIYFFSAPANCYIAWNWLASTLEGPVVMLWSKLPPEFRPNPGASSTTPVIARAPEPAPATATSQQPDQADPEVKSAPESVNTNSSETSHSETPAVPSPESTSAPENALVPKPVKITRGKGKPVQFGKGKIQGVPFYQTIINLKDPETFLVVGLPNKAQMANSASFSKGHENFDCMIKRFPAAVVVNGTFFSKDEQERVMGNMVSQGRFLKYSQWENYGTTLGIKSGNEPEMVTARSEGTPSWDEHWFSITCGPRLVKDGDIWLAPELEGFTDDHVLNIGPRAAIGFPKSKDKLYIVTFLRGLSLEEEARLMKDIGCYQAMNLDGGASKALAHEGKVLVTPGRGLTNVIVVYDTKHPAPDSVVASWMHFQDTGHAEGI